MNTSDSSPSATDEQLVADDAGGPVADPLLSQGAVILKPRKARPFYGRHPWVLDSAIERIEGDPADGDIVDLVSEKGKFIARGLLNSKSRIRVRLYTWQPSDALDDAFWRRRLEQAISLRDRLGYNDPAGAARLVYSEGDSLSGLVIDRYADYLVVQPTGLGLALRLNQLVPFLAERLKPRGIVVRYERGVARTEGIELAEGPFWGEPPDTAVFIQEHGLKYGIDLSQGQKTGFYLDQRENRRVAASYMPGRSVLDLCCYSGGFSLCAAALGHAREVLAIDNSAKATALGKANADLNRIANIHFETGDCFDALDALVGQRRKFGAVILDPPKFARSRQALNDALRAYHRLNRMAVELLEPDGILVTCSCSGHVTREDFMLMLSGVSQQTGRTIQVLDQRGASPDHPVSTACLETEYLKCFICRVV